MCSSRSVKKLMLWLVFMCYVAFLCKIYWRTATSMAPSYDPSLTNGKLLIDTPGYQLPNYDAFDKSIMNILEEAPKNLDCTRNQKPLTTGLSNYTQNGESVLRSALVYHTDRLQREYAVNFAECCYRAISRNNSDPQNPDTVFSFEKTCHLITEEITYIDDQAIIVSCTANGRIIYTNIHIFVQTRTRNFESAALKYKRTNESQLSVLVFGIDSISKLNMKRFMPKTLQILKDYGAIDLRGFNRVDENTYPNIIPLLTGKFKEHWWNQVPGDDMGMPFFDGMPFLWKNFSQAGYRTVYGEDCVNLGLFHYLHFKKGFKNVPTDYYLHPYLQAAEETLGWRGGLAWVASCMSCLGPVSSLQTLINFAADASQVLRSDPYFSFLWSSALTHDRVEFTKLADDPSAEFISRMLENDYWNNTIVLFMSDHGIRFGNIRKSYLGRMEENLPFGFLIVPKWFQNTYPEAFGNLVHNQNRLVTHFDLRVTLLDIAHGKYKDETYVNQEYDPLQIPSKVSLFRKIPGTRTCLNALIPIHFCSGIHATEVTHDNAAFSATKYAFDTLNAGLSAFPVCHQYTNFTMVRAYVIHLFQGEIQDTSSQDSVYYAIQWTTNPGTAHLEAMVEVLLTSNNKMVPKFTLKGPISRLNSYEGESNCVADKDIEFKKFCLCKGSIPS